MFPGTLCPTYQFCQIYVVFGISAEMIILRRSRCFNIFTYFFYICSHISHMFPHISNAFHIIPIYFQMFLIYVHIFPICQGLNPHMSGVKPLYPLTPIPYGGPMVSISPLSYAYSPISPIPYSRDVQEGGDLQYLILNFLASARGLCTLQSFVGWPGPWAWARAHVRGTHGH